MSCSIKGLPFGMPVRTERESVSVCLCVFVCVRVRLNVYFSICICISYLTVVNVWLLYLLSLSIKSDKNRICHVQFVMRGS